MKYPFTPFSSLVSPSGLVTYDFETMVTRVAKNVGSSAQRYDDLNVFSVPFLLHTCTRFGQSLANNRAFRNHLGQQAYAAAKHFFPIALVRRSTGAPGLDLEIVLSQNFKSMSPHDWDNQRVRSEVELWGKALIAELTYLNLGETGASGLNIQQCLDAILEVLLCKSEAKETSHHSYYLSFANSEITQVRYDGETLSEIETIDLIKCYMALVELFVAGRSTSGRMQGSFDKFRNDSSFACAEMAAFIFSRVATPFEILHLCPEILLAIEYSLGFSSFECHTFAYEKHPKFDQTYPPCRFVTALEYLAKRNISVGIERPNIDRFRQISFDLFSMPGEIFISAKRGEFSIGDNGNTSSSPQKPMEADWYEWYSYLGTTASNVLFSTFSCLTEFFIFGLDAEKFVRNEAIRKFEFAPFILDQQAEIFASSYFRLDEYANGEDVLAMLKGFHQANLSSYWLNDFMLGSETPRAFPYYVPKSVLFDRWMGETEELFFRELLGEQ